MSEELKKNAPALPEENKAAEKKKHYITAKESRQIAKNNRKTVRELQKTRSSYKREDYVTQMKNPENIVEFENLHTYFFTDNGVVKAVNGVSFDIPQGSTVGVVGESGCGKSVSSLSLMQLVQGPSGQIVSGSIRFKSQEFVRDEKGNAVPACERNEDGSLKLEETVEKCTSYRAPVFRRDEKGELSKYYELETDGKVKEEDVLLRDPVPDGETVLTEGWVWLPVYKRNKKAYVFEKDAEGNAFPVYATEFVDGVYCVKCDPVIVKTQEKLVYQGGEAERVSYTGKSMTMPVFKRDEEGRLVVKKNEKGELLPVFELVGEGAKERVKEETVLLDDTLKTPVFVKNAVGEERVAVETENGAAKEVPVRTLATKTVCITGKQSVPSLKRDEKGNPLYETDEKGNAVPLYAEGEEELPVTLKLKLKPVQVKDENGGYLFETKNVVYDVAKMPVKDMTAIRGREIAMIFQEPMTSLNPVFTIGYQLDEVTLLHVNGATKESAKARSLEMLELVGIAMPEHVYKSYPHQLSGGMRQRVMIAMALCCNPKLIIADEPTTALDVTIQAQILDLLRDVKQKISGSIMLITHDLGVIAEMVDYVVVMYAGRIVEKGTVQEIFKNPLHPYTVGLQKSKPVVRRQVDRLYSIPGNVPNPINMPTYCYFRGRCNRRCEKCAGDYPPLMQVSPTHFVACWRAEETLKMQQEAEKSAETKQAAEAKPAPTPKKRTTKKSTEEKK